MCKIIVVAAQKGDVGKTSMVRNLSYSLAEIGKRVLAVDFDPRNMAWNQTLNRSNI